MGPTSSASAADYGTIMLVGLILLLVLVLLLWWVSLTRKTARLTRKTRKPKVEVPRKQSGETATQRGLSAQERQVLQAIAVRSGLRRHEGIFSSSAAFDKGAAVLLAELSRHRYTEESEHLKRAVASLRAKLGFAPVNRVNQTTDRSERGSRTIPEGEKVELMVQGGRERVVVAGTIAHNDAIGLAVKLNSAVDHAPGRHWRVRYCIDSSIWEFDTAAIGGEGDKLVLKHSPRIRFVNRRRFPRTATNREALVAAFPLVRSVEAVWRPEESGLAQGAEQGGAVSLVVPEFVSAVVTEVAAAGLRLRSSLRVSEGDRVLVLFGATDDPVRAEGQNRDAAQSCMVEHIGHVQHCQSVGDAMSIAIEFTGLNREEMDELVHLPGTGKHQHYTGDFRGAASEEETGEHPGTETAVESPLVQGV